MPYDDLLRIINQVRENKHQGPINEMPPGLRLREDLGFESLDLAELTVRVEEEYKADVFANGLVHTVGEVLAKIAAAPHR